MINLISKKTSELTKKEIQLITNLKKQKWNYGILTQLKWFKKNIKKNDIHNLLKINKKLIGYTALRICRVDHSDYKNYLLFDTLVIDKKEREKKYAELLMYFNNKIIKKKKKISFLICSKYMLKFYSKYDWKKINKVNFTIADHVSSKEGMTYNDISKRGKKFIFYVTK